MAERIEVVVKDVDIKFTSMVILMVKAALASIPALIILAVFVGVAAGVLDGLTS